MRIDFYTHPHKRQRKDLFTLSTKVAEADFTNSGIVIDIYNDLTFITNDLRHHAKNEETFVHPLLAKKIPHRERELHDEHVELKKLLLDLETNCLHLQALSSHHQKIQTQGVEFYRALNRFIAEYLVHINEEEYMMQNLWEIAMDAELKAMMIAFQTDDGMEQGRQWLSNHLPAMNLSDRQLMFNTAQLLAPEHVFSKMCGLTKEILVQEQWQEIF